jgi:hypothetical protein
MSLTAPWKLTNATRTGFPWHVDSCVRDHFFALLLIGLVTLPLVAGCSLSPVSPLASQGDPIAPMLMAQPGRVLNGFSTFIYQPCVTITLPTRGPAAGIERIDLSVLASNQLVIASATANYAPYMLRQNLQCEGPIVSTSAFVGVVGTSYRVTATYRFIDGTTGGSLTSTSTFQ